MNPAGRAHHRVAGMAGGKRTRPREKPAARLVIPGRRGRVADIINDEQAWAGQHMVSTRQAAEDKAMGKLLTVLIL